VFRARGASVTPERGRPEGGESPGATAPSTEPTGEAEMRDLNQTASSGPLIGRDAELRAIRDTLSSAEDGVAEVSIVLLRGASGVGKSRIAEEAVRSAGERGWRAASGRASPVESGLPDALLQGTFHPWFSDVGAERLSVLTRGRLDDLRPMFPRLPGVRSDVVDPRDSESRARGYWTLSEILKAVGEEAPLLVTFEDMEWADPSSLEAIHFVARQLPGTPVLLLGCIADDRASANGKLREFVDSLGRSRLLRSIAVHPFTELEVETFVSERFATPRERCARFARQLWEWTGGNAFFLEATLSSLVEAGQLRETREGWVGWESRLRLSPAASIEDAVLHRVERLPARAREILELIAIMGTRAEYEFLEQLSGVAAADMLEVVDLLSEGGFILEEEEAGRLHLTFTHALVRDAIHRSIGAARRRFLHLRVLELLREGGPDRWAAAGGAEAIASHLLHLPSSQWTPEDRETLAQAGRRALENGAEARAAEFLRAAMGQILSGGGEGEMDPSLAIDLSRALRLSGQWDEAAGILSDVVDHLEATQADPDHLAEARRRLAMTHLGGGEPDLALRVLSPLDEPAYGDIAPWRMSRARLVRAAALHQIGRPADGRAEAERSLEMAREVGDEGLRARAHRVLTLSYLWTGPPERARHHGLRSLELAETSGDLQLAGRVHWALAVVAGLTGRAGEAEKHLARCREIAESLRSPALKLAWMEVAVERSAGVGEWTEGVALGEEALDLAAALNRRSTRIRLMVWTGLLHLGRGGVDRARELLDEAWEASGAGGDGGRKLASDMHLLIPAHLGRARLLLAEQRFEDAYACAERGLALADEAGYVPWAIHRLLPTMAEACVWIGDLEGAGRVGERLRRESQRLDHPLGLAWAEVCDAVLVWQGGDPRRGAELLGSAAARLEAIPAIPDAARARRQVAGRLADLGEMEGAVSELEWAHEVFVKLSMETELEKARGQFREMGLRPPSRSLYEGVDGITSRELEIIRHVADRKSNKAIGRALSISPRTVSTHLTNVYRKLDVENRGALVDRARDEGWI
jgi:DNA-binding CsgD family transcriptional regulator